MTIHYATRMGTPACSATPDDQYGRRVLNLERDVDHIDCSACIEAIRQPTITPTPEIPITHLAGADGKSACGSTPINSNGIRVMYVATALDAVDCPLCHPDDEPVEAENPPVESAPDVISDETGETDDDS